MAFWVGICVCLAVFVWLAARESALLKLPEDDRFIGFRYSRNFARGNGLVYNTGERVEGYTSFLWFFLVGLLIKVGFDPATHSQLLSLALGIATIIVVARTARHCDSEPDRLLPLALVPPLLLAISDKFAYWAGSGSGIPMYALAILLASNARLRELNKPRCFPVSSILLALVALIRFDGLLFYAFFFAHSVLLALIGPAPRPSLRSFVTAEARRFSVFLLIYLPYTIWRLVYYGGLLPNTFYAKTQFADGLSAQLIYGAAYTYAFFASTAGIFFLVGLSALFSRGLRASASLRLTLIVGQTLFIVAVGGDHMRFSRFFVPILPLLFLFLADGVEVLASWTSKLRRPAARAATVFLVAGLAWVVVDFGFDSISRQARVPGLASPDPRKSSGVLGAILKKGREIDSPMALQIPDLEIRLKSFGLWLRENAHPDASVFTAAAGVIGYYSQLYTVDMWGLTDAHIAHLSAQSPEKFFPGHLKSDLEYVLAKQPTYFCLPRGIFGFSEMTKEYGRFYVPCELPTAEGSKVHVRAEDRLIDLGPGDSPVHIRQGWGLPLVAEGQDFRTMVARTAALIVYLYQPQERTITIRAKGIGPLASDWIALEVNGKFAGRANLSDQFQNLGFVCDSDLFKFGVNRLELSAGPAAGCAVDWLRTEEPVLVGPRP